MIKKKKWFIALIVVLASVCVPAFYNGLVVGEYIIETDVFGKIKVKQMVSKSCAMHNGSNNKKGAIVST